MGKVLSEFNNGFPGAISRSVDDIVISVSNASETALPFGIPVFQKPGEQSCVPFDMSAPANTPAERFLGFTVRAGDKTPETYGSADASYGPDDPVDVIVRGSVVVSLESNASPGQPVYVRKSDGRLTAQAGTEGSTVLLPNVVIRQFRDSLRRAEVVLKNRNAL